MPKNPGNVMVVHVIQSKAKNLIAALSSHVAPLAGMTL